MNFKKRIATLLVAFTFVGATFFMPVIVGAVQIYNGIDVYEGDDIENWNAIKSDGISVAILKATEGETFNDKYCYYRYPKVKAAGLKVGFYHFADNDGQPIAQAQHFLNRVQGLKSDTVLFLDIEVDTQWTKYQAISFTNQFINYVQARGYQAGVYTGAYFYKEYLQGNIPNVPLWIADYGSQPYTYPSQSWQYGIHTINGANGDVDLDYFTNNIFLNGVVPVTSTAVSTPTVQTIIRNSKTATLQSNLNSLLQWKLSVDGIQGSQTAMATKQFQRMVGLTQDGVDGLYTNSAINKVMAKPLLKYNSTGLAVRYLQYRLGITADGYFKGQTRQAVINYQKAHRLTPDGVVGYCTWKSLLGL